uniref:EGF-like domain-containing protein n=1 Tax=Plectus sambesii TaxID=2011161 RepID=A0A914WTI4_9BILA
MFWFQCFFVQVLTAVTWGAIAGPGCPPDYCQNGATCFMDSNNNLECLCSDEYQGSRCELPSGPYHSEPSDQIHPIPIDDMNTFHSMNTTGNMERTNEVRATRDMTMRLVHTFIVFVYSHTNEWR